MSWWRTRWRPRGWSALQAFRKDGTVLRATVGTRRKARTGNRR
jgi:hypothetical protein